jgi:hypothetical protein
MLAELRANLEKQNVNKFTINLVKQLERATPLTPTANSAIEYLK